ncbi:MAG: hypothetical protein ACRCWR_06810 [Saezia sp.]
MLAVSPYSHESAYKGAGADGSGGSAMQQVICVGLYTAMALVLR